MLDSLRKGAGTWVAKAFLVVLVLSFVVWGVADVFRGFGHDVAAKVGDTEISLQQFDQAYRRELNMLGQRFGRPLTPQEGAQFGVPQQVLGQLLATTVLDETAAKMNLGVSDDKLIDEIQHDPNFRGANGQFDRNTLLRLLQANDMSEQDYVADRRSSEKRQQLIAGIASGIQVPDAMLEAFNDYKNETRTARYLLLTPAQVGDIAAPDDATLQSYFDANKAKYRAPEYRKITYLELTPEALAKPADVTDDEAQKLYEQTKSNFSEPERRHLLQIPFKTQDDAQKAEAELKAGKTFDDLRKERNLSDKDVDLGTLAKADIVDPAIADTAFSMKKGDVSQPIEGRFTIAIIKVDDITPAHVRPFAEVKDELKKQAAERHAASEVLETRNQIEDARAGGSTLSEIASKFDLKAVTPAPFDNSGKDEKGEPVALPQADSLVRSAFDSDVGVENDPLSVGQNGYLWFNVDDVTAAHDRKLSEVHDRVVADWTADQRAKKLEDLAKDAHDRVAKGESLDAVAASLGVKVKTSDELKRDGTSADFSADATSALFSAPKGSVENAKGKDGDHIVLVVNSVSTPAFFKQASDVQQIKQQLAGQLQNSLINQYVEHLERTTSIKVNQNAIAKQIGGNSGSANR